MWKSSSERTEVVQNSHAKVWSIPVHKDGVEDEPFLVMERKDAVAIYTSNDEGEILLVQQHRYAAGKVGWELPQGAIEVGESPLKAAERELLEEANMLSLESGFVISELYEAADWCTSLCHVVVIPHAQLCKEGKAELHAKWCSLEEINMLVNKGELFDAVTLAALHIVLFSSHKIKIR